MTVAVSDYGRRYLLDVERDGSVTVRDRESGAASRGLPAFSADTREQAEALIVRHCRLCRYGTGTYTITGWPEDPMLDDLYAAGEMFRATYAAMQDGGAA